MRKTPQPNLQISRWPNNDPSQEQQESCPNIYRFLCNNIHLYDHANRRDSGSIIKSSTHVLGRARKEGKSCGGVGWSGKGKTACVSMSFSKSKGKIKGRDVKEKKRLNTECYEADQVGNFENLNINLLANIKNLREKYSQTTTNTNINANINVNIRNLQFNRLEPGYVRKKDRYRQIFGQKPKYIYVKADDKDGPRKNCITSSASLFKPR